MSNSYSYIHIQHVTFKLKQESNYIIFVIVRKNHNFINKIIDINSNDHYFYLVKCKKR